MISRGHEHTKSVFNIIAQKEEFNFQGSYQAFSFTNNKFNIRKETLYYDFGIKSGPHIIINKNNGRHDYLTYNYEDDELKGTSFSSLIV